MLRCLTFCSNPVNGGTARMFYELCTEWSRLPEAGGVAMYPYVDSANNVVIYDKIDGLRRLPVRSEATVCGEYPLRAGRLERLHAKVSRSRAYAPVRRENIELFKKTLTDGGYNAVLIHNGGYVGDDLCNQLIEAAYAVGVKKRVMVFHNDFDRRGLRRLIYKSYDRLIDAAATDLVTVSDYTRGRILHSSYLRSDISVIYNGITVGTTLSREEKLAALSAPENIGLGQPWTSFGGDETALLMIGNFSYVKGHMTMLRALSALRDELRCSNWHLTVIGNIYEQDCYDECADYIHSRGLTDRVTILHGIHNASEYTDLFDIALVPSREDESFGLISVEAMAKGTPVVATDCGGIPEVVYDGRDGCIVPIDDAAAFADAIKRLADDSALREACSANCVADYHSRFTPAPMARAYAKILSG